jgi:methylisocitrate lyase
MMARAAEDFYKTLRTAGTQSALTDRMQTRAELYEVLDYHSYERQLDALAQKPPKNETP